MAENETKPDYQLLDGLEPSLQSIEIDGVPETSIQRVSYGKAAGQMPWVEIAFYSKASPRYARDLRTFRVRYEGDKGDFFIDSAASLTLIGKTTMSADGDAAWIPVRVHRYCAQVLVLDGVEQL
jgi:hypothetical protein